MAIQFKDGIMTLRNENAINWTKEQLKLAFYLYCQTPFGKLHSRNPAIIELSKLIGRTPSALAMKLVNFASLDPSITTSGRVGLRSVSKLDRTIWDEFHLNWELLAVECEQLLRDLKQKRQTKVSVKRESDEDFVIEDFTGETRQALVEQRIKQSFFRRAVLSSYRSRCCMSGVAEPRLLVASHIVPWSKDRANRLNPSNGLCLSAIHDKAFDKGLITLSVNLRIILSRELRRREEAFIKEVFLPLENKVIEMPERFAPGAEFLEHHRRHIFVGD
jgi:hypothetical protein